MSLNKYELLYILIIKLEQKLQIMLYVDVK